VNCPTCNTHLPSGTDHCPRCGHVLQVAPAPANPPEAPAAAQATETAPKQKHPDPTPAGGGSAASPTEPAQRAIKALSVAVAIVVALVALGLLAVHLRGATSPAVAPSGPGISADPTSSRDPSTELAQVETILSESVSSRDQLHHALQTACADSSDAVSSIQGVLSRRRAEIAEAKSLDLSAVPDGARIRSDLVALLRDSEKADSAYATSIRDINEQGCGAGAIAFRRGNSLSVTAQHAKSAFFKIWTPTAERYGLRPYDAASV
jgi:hypothetical protein